MRGKPLLLFQLAKIENRNESTTDLFCRNLFCLIESRHIECNGGQKICLTGRVKGKVNSSEHSDFFSS